MIRSVSILLLSAMISLYSTAQSRWTQQYMDGWNAPAKKLNISYDHGNLLAGWLTLNYPPYSWLIKTDINGNVLWQKMIGGINNSSIGCSHFCQNFYGEIFLSGATIVDGDANPLIIKLNSCGEKEWCREISTTSNNDSFRDVVSAPDGGCIAIISGAYLPLLINKTGLMKFSSDGDLLWQKYFESSDTNIFGENLSTLIMTPDQGYLLTGFCYYIDPDNPSYGWLHPYYIKADSLGNLEWETIVHQETGDIGGQAYMSLVNPSGNCYYSCISHYYTSDTLYTTRPAIVKIDLQGNVLDVYDLVQGNYDLGKIMTFDFINDSILTGSAFWGNDEEPYESRVILFDTLGHIIDYVTVMNDYFLGFVKTTFDDKIIIFKSDNTDGELDPTLIKLNMDLQQDTFYTRPFVYDSLCPYQVVSDTIVPDDCGVIVGIEEQGGGEAWRQGDLEVWPNPASGVLSVKCLGLSAGISSSLAVVDIFGRQVLSSPCSPHTRGPMGGGREGGGGWQIDVSSLPAGIYVAVVRDERTIIGTTKFVVAR